MALGQFHPISAKGSEPASENFLQFLENVHNGKGRKLSLLHSDHFWKMGGNCPWCILTIFGKWEETVPTPFWTFFRNRRKLSFHISFFCEMGGNCLILYATLFLECLFWLASWEEKVPQGKYHGMSFSLENQMKGKYLTRKIVLHGGKSPGGFILGKIFC